MKIKKMLTRLSDPVSKKEDRSRREFILNILLLGTIFLSAISIIASEIDILFLKTTEENSHGIGIIPLYAIFFVFLVLFVISKLGKSRLSAYLFIGIYASLFIYISFHWGVYTPQGLLIFALIVTMSGVLIGSGFSFFVMSFCASIIVVLFYLQNNGTIAIDSNWTQEPINSGDVLVYIATIFVIFIVSWLFNREIIKSLKRARNSERELKKERDTLEAKVIERTEELRKTQYEKLRQLYRFAEFGRLSSGLFHDLNNYLTALSLNLEKAKTDDGKESLDVKKYLIQANKVSNKMEDFIGAIQKQLQKQETKTSFSLNKEIENVLKIFSYRSKKEGVEIKYVQTDQIITFGNPLKFNQLITNLISNALDSYLGFQSDRDKYVWIYIKKDLDSAVITVEDCGCGIPGENMEKIFDPFFTTKDPDHGTGIGLSTTREIIKNDFGGEIKVQSQREKGSIFRIILPIKNNEK